LAVSAFAACSSGGAGPEEQTPGVDADDQDALGEVSKDALDAKASDALDAGDAVKADSLGDAEEASGEVDDDAIEVEDSGETDAGETPDEGPEATTDADTTAPQDGGDVAVEVDAGPQVLIPSCAKAPNGTLSCDFCSKCAAGEICGPDGKTYTNDCFAICALKITDTADLKKLKQGKCPPCAACTATEIAADKASGCDPNDTTAAAASAYSCVTTKTGLKISMCACQTACAMADGTGVSKTKGACKTSCNSPPPSGAGCSSNVYAPVCAKEDGKTYFDSCQLQHCEACAPDGKTVTAECKAAGGKLTKECDAECFDAAAYPTCSTKKECAPVCGIMPDDSGKTFRNACIAGVEGAKLGDCTMYPLSKKCSALLYVEQNKPCFPTVSYAIDQPVCGEGYITYFNASELNAWGKGKLYDGACVCECDDNKNEVCGEDGLTYRNGCQAKCWNKENPAFSYTAGPC
jgi:hypothetical protein